MDSPGPDFLWFLAAWTVLLTFGIAAMIASEGLIIRFKRWREYRHGSRP